MAAHQPTSLPVPPVAPTRPFVRHNHGDDVVDPYAWMRDTSDPELLDYLRAENAYADAMTAHLDGLRETLFTEIKERTQESDLSVPVAYRGWWYYGRTREGLQYPLQCRVPLRAGAVRPTPSPAVALEAAPDDEQVVVDANVEAQGHDFFALGASEVDLTGELVAYSVDLVGDERFVLRVRNIATRQLLDDSVIGMGYGLVWSADSAYLFYTRVDEAWRPHQLWRHRVGAPADTDELVYQEPDERYWMGIGTSRDDRWLQLAIGSKNTSEHRLLDLADPTGTPQVVCPRREGVEYDVEVAGDRLLIVHNVDRADFEVAWAPLDAGHNPQGKDAAAWHPWFRPARGDRVTGVDAFASHAVVSLRRAGQSAVALAPRDSAAEAGFAAPIDLPFEEAVRTVGLGSNPDWQARAIQLIYESMLTPKTVLEVDVATGTRSVLKRQPVLGDFDPARYRQHRVWANADDGTKIPMSLVARADVPLDGSAPGVLLGYGAYEIPLDPYFSIARLLLLDRGVVYAMAHVRGGGELGRSWYDGGRLEHKTNSFTDLVACAGELGTGGWVDPGRLALNGGSAGGLLVGAAMNLAPEAFAVVQADVPFVDPLNTILDPSLPLTVTEWEEWGNPLDDPAVYWRLKGYSPYENVRATAYPAVLVTTSLNDTRVSVTEPAKWVARLRTLATNDPATRPILLRTELSAGHGGRSGRYDAWRELAWEQAVVLDRLGATERLAEGKLSE